MYVSRIEPVLKVFRTELAWHIFSFFFSPFFWRGGGPLAHIQFIISYQAEKP